MSDIGGGWPLFEPAVTTLGHAMLRLASAGDGDLLAAVHGVDDPPVLVTAEDAWEDFVAELDGDVASLAVRLRAAGARIVTSELHGGEQLLTLTASLDGPLLVSVTQRFPIGAGGASVLHMASVVVGRRERRYSGDAARQLAEAGALLAGDERLYVPATRDPGQSTPTDGRFGR